MKRLTTLLLVVMLVPMLAMAKPIAARYENEVFSEVTVTNDVVYGQNYSVLSGTLTLEDLKMDIYEPTNDTVGGTFYDPNGRPVIILLHAGSFLPKGPFLPFGDKEDSTLIEMCQQFAKRGFVAISADYRLGWNPLSSSQDGRAGSIINAVYRAMQDARGLVRFLRADAAGANTYNIDPYRIIMGGTNSGAYVSLAVGAFNKQSEINLLKFRYSTTGESYIDQDATGGFYGEGGYIGTNYVNYPGYSSAVQCILNLGGAIGDTSWMEADEPPSVNFHGIADPLTPFGTDIVIVSATGDPVVEVSGSRDVAYKQDALGLNADWISAAFSDNYTMAANAKTPAVEGLFWFGDGYGQPAAANGFEPWAWYDSSEVKIIDAGNPSASFPGPYTGYGSAANPYASRAKAETYIDSIMGYFIPRLMVTMSNVDSTAVQTADPSDTAVTAPVGIAGHFLPDDLMQVYPNPATSELVFALPNANYAMDRVDIFDLAGRQVMTVKPYGANFDKADVTVLDPGMYLVVVTMTNGEAVQKKVLIE